MQQLEEKRSEEVVKDSIKINRKVFKKYKSAEDIFKNVKIKEKNILILNNGIKELKYIDYDNLNNASLRIFAYNLFTKYNETNEFINNGNKIIVTKSGINESIQKIFQNKIQRNLLRIHLLIFANLGKIIENAKLVNQSLEIKNRKNIIFWSYYLDGIVVDKINYSLLFDVRTMENGQNQYRIQRLKKVDSTVGDND